MCTWQNLPYSLPTNHLYSKTGEHSSNKSYICNILQHTCGCAIFSKQVDFNITSDTATLNHCTYVCNSIFVNCDLTLLKTNCNTCRITLVHMALYVCCEFVKVIGAMQPTTSNPTLPSQFIQVQKSNSLLSLGFSTQQTQQTALTEALCTAFRLKEGNRHVHLSFTCNSMKMSNYLVGVNFDTLKSKLGVGILGPLLQD